MRRLITVFLLIALCVSCSKEVNNTITYTISPNSIDSIPLLKVKASFRPNAEGETILLFQDKAWGQDSLHNVIKELKLVSEEGEITVNKDSGWFAITHPKDLKTIEIEYTIQQDSKGDLTTWDTYRPVIQPEYFHMFSHNCFMLPKHILKESEDNFNVDLEWKDFPIDYNMANSFGSNERQQKIENVSEEEFHTAVFVGGDFRVHNIDVEGNKVAFIIRGNWEAFKDSTMIDVLDKTVTAQRNFWQDHSQEYFAVTLMPTVLERGSSFQGSGLTNSFATNASNNKYLEVIQLVYLFNHELQHNWTGSLIKNADEEKQYWFSEGFTDYYTIKNIAKGKIYNLDESYFIDEFNGFIRALYTNPVREMPNSELNYENFWSGIEGIQKLPYRRGALFAFYLDYKIKQDSNGEKSLDDVLLEFKNDALKSEQKIDHPYFIKTVNKYLKEDVTSFFNDHIEDGKLFNLEAILNDFGFEYHPTTKVFDLGFTYTEDNRAVATIDENSEAYKAGLRVNDKFRSISVYNGYIEYQAEFIVMRDGKDIPIKYYPVKDATVPQLKDNAHNASFLNF